MPALPHAVPPLHERPFDLPGTSDPEQMISAALCALGAAGADDDTCLVALAVR